MSDEDMSDDKKQPREGSTPSSRKSGEGRQRADGSFFPRAGYDWMEEEMSTRLTDTTVAMPPPSSPMGRTRAMLTVMSGPSAGRAYSVSERETLIGRGREAHVRLDDAGASRLHARIVVLEDGEYLLEDLGSTNGTFVGGKKVDRAQLQSGDRIHVGPNVTVSFAIMDSQAELMTHQLYESAMRDALTRAHNRRYFLERLSSELAFALRHDGLLSLIMFDIDHFKRINDAHGHPAGDEVLREVSAQIGRMIRAEDVFARYGGEEFVLLVRGIDPAKVGRFAERIRTSIENLEVASESAILRVTISAGYVSLSELPSETQTEMALLRLADERLYRAKEGGRNRCCGGS
ncbi:MAG TPA: GGDEF domain-containing protein [Polyangiaceae bacterium]|nr:GGDEF domain-containing protein [Polyangiaceae bacterium]